MSAGVRECNCHLGRLDTATSCFQPQRRLLVRPAPGRACCLTSVIGGPHLLPWLPSVHTDPRHRGPRPARPSLTCRLPSLALRALRWGPRVFSAVVRLLRRRLPAWISGPARRFPSCSRYPCHRGSSSNEAPAPPSTASSALLCSRAGGGGEGGASAPAPPTAAPSSPGLCAGPHPRTRVGRLALAPPVVRVRSRQPSATSLVDSVYE